MSNHDQITARLTQIFRSVFDDDSITLHDEMTADDLEDWDSQSHITLVVACEKEFGLRMTPAEVGRLKNVGEMVKLLVERGTR
jgi:acyl carrier protein